MKDLGSLSLTTPGPYDIAPGLAVLATCGFSWQVAHVLMSLTS